MSRSLPRAALVLIVCGSLIVILSNGFRSTSGLFLQPMSLANGWTRETFSFAIALQHVFWGLAAPVFGAVADKFGAGRTLALGALMMAFGYWGMAHSQNPAELAITAGLLVGVGFSGAGLSIVLGVFARAVDAAHRSMVLGTCTAAGSLGQFLMLPLGQAMISAWGWREALVAQAFAVLLILPLARVLAGRPQHRASAGPEQSMREAIRTAFGDRSFHLIFWGYFTCGFQVMFIALHLPSYLTDKGLSPSLGATAIALVGLFNVIGSLGFGWLGGRYAKRHLLAALYLLRSAVVALFVLMPVTDFSVYLFSVLLGLLWLSTVPLTSGLVAHIYGLRYVTMLTGIVFLGHQVGSFLGSWMGGWIFDATGSYDIAWWLIIGSGIYAALIHLPIRETPLAPRPAAA